MLTRLHTRPRQEQLSVARIQRFRREVLRWYARCGRRYPWRTPSAGLYARVVSEVLLQRTQADSVARYYRRFTRTYPSWSRLAQASLTEIEEILRPLGLWKRRALALRALAPAATKLRGKFPRDRVALERLPGVGQYVASAILLFGHGQCEPLLDTNMARVLERYFGPRTLADIRHDPYLQRLSRRVVTGPKPERVSWALLDLAALRCKPRAPLCPECPVSARCRFRRLRQGTSRSLHLPQ
ncbi:MAG: hypothetical protein IPG75_15270 [Gemmatimonadetes bacterium]|nr:hypothetical protein [Gemmatimonadota bacterium]